MAYYRKQTKNHWARDDPAFAVVQVGLLLVASLAYSVAFRPAQGYLLTTIVGFAIKSVLINFVGVGAVMATVGKQIADRHLATVGRTHVKQTVEWLYAFDIHCNAFFPFFVMVYGMQFFLLPIVLGTSVMSLIISNTLFAVAFSWYFYITHLGYRGTYITRRLSEGSALTEEVYLKRVGFAFEFIQSSSDSTHLNPPLPIQQRSRSSPTPRYSYFPLRRWYFSTYSTSSATPLAWVSTDRESWRISILSRGRTACT